MAEKKEETNKEEVQKTDLPLAPLAFITIGVIALAEKHFPSLEIWPYVLIALGLIVLFKKEF